MSDTGNAFFQRVYEVVARIPAGRVVSYGGIARMLGDPRAARQVGWAMRRCPDGLPWQRVVKADGAIAGGGWAEVRRALLEAEGVPFTPDGRVDMAACRWPDRPRADGIDARESGARATGALQEVSGHGQERMER